MFRRSRKYKPNPDRVTYSTSGSVFDDGNYGDSRLISFTSSYLSSSYGTFKDLDYTGSGFSFEIIFDLNRPNSCKGRWDQLIGNGYQLYSATNRGWGVSTGVEAYYGWYSPRYTFYVNDGTSSLQCKSAYLTGKNYLVGTYDHLSKTSSLYRNGILESRSFASTILFGEGTRSLSNTRNFLINHSCYSYYVYNSDHDIYMARLWNRPLTSAEVSQLYTNYSSEGKTTLTSSFDTSSLHSEWLFNQTCDVNGNTGSTYIFDTQGRNHLAMGNRQYIPTATGSFKMVYPPHTATNICPSVVFKINGGIDVLNIPTSSVVFPLHYWFEVDETPYFNSENHLSSGWQDRKGTYRAYLKPNHDYFWKVKIKDSTYPPHVSNWSTINRFRTRPAKTWYVRPMISWGFYTMGLSKPNTGSYGTQDGTSYENAWNGLLGVKWGADGFLNGEWNSRGPEGVCSGDTVYICGTHAHIMNSGSSTATFYNYDGMFFIKESGASEDYPITFRGDYPGDPAVITGNARTWNTGSWAGPDENGIYSSSTWARKLMYQKTGSNLVVLPDQGVTTWTGNIPGRYFAGNINYIRTIDGNNPKDCELFCDGNFNGFSFDLGIHKYITFKNFTGYTMDFKHYDYVQIGSQYGTPNGIGFNNLSRYIKFEGCRFIYETIFVPTKGIDHWMWDGCEIASASNGIYAQIPNTAVPPLQTGSCYLTIKNCHIHNLGERPDFYHQDAHGIGIQGGEGHIVENNHIHHGGTLIEFWSGNSEMKNHIIRNNYLHDGIPHLTSGGGITISGDNTTAIEGKRTGFKIYNNILCDCPINTGSATWGGGIGSNSKDYTEIFNNTIVNCRRGIGIDVETSGRVSASIYNNIIVSPWTDRYLEFISAINPGVLFISGNLFYSASNATNTSQFYFSNCPVNTSSLLSVNTFGQDPLFTSSLSSSKEDFQLTSGSPAIGAGINTTVLKDIGGRVRPLPPSAGAWDYV